MLKDQFKDIKTFQNADQTKVAIIEDDNSLKYAQQPEESDDKDEMVVKGMEEDE